MTDHPFLHALAESHRYRALLLDLRGKVIRIRSIAADDDEGASNMARAMLDGRALELWDRSRFIERFGPVQT